MTRADDTRAASLALPLPRPLEATITVERALVFLGPGALEVFAVARRGRLIGGLTRTELERAAVSGLAELRLSDLLVADPQLVAANASTRRVRKIMNSGPAPFVLVRAAGAPPSGFIDRLRLAGPGRGAEEWGSVPGRGPTRLLGALRRCISETALISLEELGRRASRSRGRACLVGGVVRDLLLGRSTRDLDVIVEGELDSLLRGAGRKRKTHSRFLTATLELDDGTMMDVAHARSERYSRPAALPDVRASTIEEDLTRRDFTINSLALSIEPRSLGSVLDLCGGAEDLARRRIRVLHGLSFVDDPTRAFRAVRLAARLEFDIERRTAHGMEVALGQGIFERLSSTRLRREVEALLGAAEFPCSIRLAARCGLLAVLSGGLRLSARTRSHIDRAAAAITWYEALQRGEAFQCWVVPLGLLLIGAEPQVTDEVLERLRPARRATGLLRRCRGSVEELLAELTRSSRPSPSRVYFACAGLEIELLLMAIACAPRQGTRNAIRRHLENQRGIQLEISGRDLLRGGVPAGPAVARGLRAALAAKLDGVAPEKGEQLRRALLAAGAGDSSA